MKQVTNTYYDIIVNGKRFVMATEKEQAENIARQYNGTVKEYTHTQWVKERRAKR